VGVGVGDVPCLSHQVLQVLPADPGAQVLNGHAVVGSHRWPVLVQPRGLGVAPSPGGSVTIPASALCVLYRDPLAEQFLAVELVDGVIRIPVILKLDESEVLLEQDIGGATELVEELLEVPLPGARGHVANVDSTTWHRHF